MIEQQQDVHGEERHRFAGLTAEQYARGIAWLSREPVSYETVPRPEDVQDWIVLIMPTVDQLAGFRAVLV